MIDSEAIIASHLHDSVREPALVYLGQPFASVLAAFAKRFASVHFRCGQCEVEYISGEHGLCIGVSSTQATIVGLGQRHNVIYVDLASVFEMSAGIGTIYPAIHAIDDVLLH